VELNLSESDGGKKKGVSARFTLKEKKYTNMGVRKRLKNRKKRQYFLFIYELCNILY